MVPIILGNSPIGMSGPRDFEGREVSPDKWGCIRFTVAPTMENQLEEKLDNDVKTEILLGFPDLTGPLFWRHLASLEEG